MFVSDTESTMLGVLGAGTSHLVVPFRAAGGERDNSERCVRFGRAFLRGPQISPRRNHRRQLTTVSVPSFAVAHRTAAVVLALVPDEPGDGEVHKRRNHPVEEPRGRRLSIRIETLVFTPPPAKGPSEPMQTSPPAQESKTTPPSSVQRVV